MPTVIDRLLQLSDEFNIKLTFAIVGALFAKDKKELYKYIPKQSPRYKNKNLDPFTSISDIGDTEGTDPYHFANSIIVKIKNYSQHEIGTHTFGHYNCLARGQNVGQFKCDLEAAIDIAKLNQIELSSIVFPKNQIVKEYLDILSSKQIQIYRGTEKSRLYNRSDVNINGSLRLLGVRILRFLDGYMNLSGYNTYDLKHLNSESESLVNIPSSRFLRPYNEQLAIFESLN